MYVCMYMRGGVYEVWWDLPCTVCIVWQVAESSTLSYCKGRVPYLVSGVDIYSSIQENSDGAVSAPGGREVQCGSFILQQGHTDRHMFGRMYIFRLTGSTISTGDVFEDINRCMNGCQQVNTIVLWSGLQHLPAQHVYMVEW